MDVWDYLAGLRRWWWILLVLPVTAFLLASFILIPPATWDVNWNSVIVFNGDPEAANNPNTLDSIILDDMALLLESGVLGDRVYLELSDDVTSRYSRDDVGKMLSAVRHGRFVEVTVSADDPTVATTVARTTQAILPEAISLYLIPPDFTRIPAHVSVTTILSEPELQTRDRLTKVAGVTFAGLVAGLTIAGVAEWLRMSYSAKYDER